MARVLFIVSLLLIVLGCASHRSEPYEVFIKSDFKNSENYKGSGKIDVSHITVTKTKEQIIAESSVIIEPNELEGFEIVDYQLTYEGSYWLETFQVFRSCSRSRCEHRFVLIIGIHA